MASSFSTSGRKPRSSISSASSRTTLLHGREVEVTLLGEVDQPAGGADDDLDTALERLDLRLVRAAAVDGEHADAAGLAGALEVTGDLHGELAGRGDDQGLRLAGGGSASAKASSLGLTRAGSSARRSPRVLPVPVLAWPMMSWPPRATGRVIAWMGKGWTMPAAASAATMSGWTSKSAKVSARRLGRGRDLGVGGGGGSGLVGPCGDAVHGWVMSLDRAGGHTRADGVVGLRPLLLGAKRADRRSSWVRPDRAGC